MTKTKISFFPALILIGSLGFLTSCVMYKEPPPALSVEYGSYSCDASRQFVAEFEKEGSRVAVMMDGRTRTFVRDTSGVYHDGTMTLTGSETHPITIYESGVPILQNCVPVTTQKQYYRKDEKFRVFDVKRDLEN